MPFKYFLLLVILSLIACSPESNVEDEGWLNHKSEIRFTHESKRKVKEEYILSYKYGDIGSIGYSEKFNTSTIVMFGSDNQSYFSMDFNGKEIGILDSCEIFVTASKDSSHFTAYGTIHGKIEITDYTDSEGYVKGTFFGLLRKRYFIEHDSTQINGSFRVYKY